LGRFGCGCGRRAKYLTILENVAYTIRPAANGDWEAHAMFFNGRRREGSDQAALDWMSKTFNEEYPRKGMLFCVGNMAKRHHTWQLLGVLRVDDTGQTSLF
jgi:hypothetical protein